jgi:hypothetical protein
MEEEKTVMGLIKIGDAKYQKFLFEKGEIYMNTQQYFRELEDRNGRGDKYEGANKIEQVKLLKLSDGKTDIELSIKAGNLKRTNVFSRYEDFNCNIYSMIGVSEDDVNKQHPLPKSNEKLGSYFTLIYDVKEFNRRIKKKLDSLNYKHTWGWVKYYDEYSYEGELTLLDKPKSFQDQKEVRYIVHSGKNEPLKIEIGSLTDIAVPFKIEDLKTFVLGNESKIQIGKHYD